MADTTKYAPVRSVRVDDQMWTKARKRAKKDGMTMSEVISRFVEGYATGNVDAPRMQMVYSAPAPDADQH